MRLFIAINFNYEIENSLCNSIELLKNCSLKGTFTIRDNLHLTLVFIGETHDADKVIKSIDLVDSSPFELKIGGLGSFKRTDGDIYWVGVEKNSNLTSVQKQLSDELLKAGFDIEKREYNPHLTLGRGVIAKGKFNKETLEIPNLSMMVDKISLMKSERINGKLTYTEIYQKQL